MFAKVQPSWLCKADRKHAGSYILSSIIIVYHFRFRFNVCRKNIYTIKGKVKSKY